MNINLLNIVNRIVAEQGENILSEPRRVSAFFADLAKDEPKPQKNAFVKCLEQGFAQTLKNVPEQDRALCKQRLAQKLHEEEGLDPGLCGETLELLAMVLFGEEKKKIYCKNCGKELQEEWKTCPYCSTSVASQIKKENEEKQQDESPSEITSVISSGSGSGGYGIEQEKPDAAASSNDTVDISRKCNGCYFYNLIKNECTRYKLPVHEAAEYKCVPSNYSSQTQPSVQPAASTSSGNASTPETVKLTGGQWFFVILFIGGAILAWNYFIYGVVSLGRIFDTWWIVWPSGAIMYYIFYFYNKSKMKK